MSEQQVHVSHEFINCDACGKSNPPKRCSRCRMVYYCDDACQRKHWPQHKFDCNHVDEQRRILAGLKGDVCDLTDDTKREGESCGICLVASPVDPVVLPCQHIFCSACVREYQRVLSSKSTPQESCCPYCRSEIPDVDRALVERAVLFSARARFNDEGSDARRENCERCLAELQKIHDWNETNVDALLTKGKVLLMLERPNLAAKAFKRAIEIEQTARENFGTMQRYLEQATTAFDAGDRAEAVQFIEKGERLLGETSSTMLPDADDREEWLWDVQIQLSKAMVAMGDQESAKKMLMDMCVQIRNHVGTRAQHRQIFMGLSRCLYEMRDYEGSIAFGSGAIEINRHIPGVHKYVALSQRASGDIEAARRTMSKAVLYEAPWDDEKKSDAASLLNDLNANS